MMDYLHEDTLIGHETPRNFLARSFNDPRHHAYLFAGSEHLGKDTVARAFVSGFIGAPVGDWSELAANPDVAVLKRDDDKKSIGVLEMRVFLKNFATSSFGGGVKIGVVLDAHELSIEASNAFLKTLEEPAGRSLFILLADDVSKIPATVASRSAVLRFLPVAERDIVNGLLVRGYGREEASSAAREANGRPGLALKMLADKKFFLARREAAAEFLSFAAMPLCSRLAGAVAYAEEQENPKEFGRLFDVWLSLLRDVFLVKTGNRDLLANVFAEEKIAAIANALSLGKIRSALVAVVDGKRFVAANVNPRLIIENIALTL
jgi:DNA polymerase III subunit delta'